MLISVKDLSEKLNAQLIGDAHQMLSAPNRIEYAQNGEITFLQYSKYSTLLSECKASAIITTKELVNTSLPFIWLVVDDPYLAFAQVLELFFPIKSPEFKQHQYFTEPNVHLGENIQIGQGVYIGYNSKIGDGVILYPQVYIGNGVEIGENVTIYPGAKVLDNSIIGNHCIIHAGAVIGTDGFGFAPKQDGTFQKIPQMGNVILHDHVEVGANTCIDRATMGSTIIQKNVKLDNLIQIGHNVIIGENTVIAAQAGIAGSSQIGPYNQIGGQAGFAPHVKTESHVKVNAQSGVSKSILKQGAIMTGTPAQSYIDYNRTQIIIKNLQKKNKTENNTKLDKHD
ncbi:MAG TPA: UDP-3-O-(3-hydroxymyristoyl)glucosamine N-acyltransferase [Chitinophagales bacterium]|nr:UDP-3-O-(3-hydroxymyristoyl)glucosamine N-acyltransferase [Chitinophagales bacterium]